MEGVDLPIAVRRARRSNVGYSPVSPGAVCSRESPTISKTPRKRRKAVRFSDPGPLTSLDDCPSTGLTPMVRRTSLGPHASLPRRRHTASPVPPGSGLAGPSLPSGFPNTGEITFLPLRQVLTGRVQRRLRRNGLSEEFLVAEQEQRRKQSEAREELQKLRDALRDRDAQIYELRNATVIVDTERIWELENEVTELKQKLEAQKPEPADETSSSGRHYDWTLAARDPFGSPITDVGDASDFGMDDDGGVAGQDTEMFGEITAIELACSTPSRGRRSRAQNSFPTPPSTSPALPIAAPWTPISRAAVTPLSHVGVQANLAEDQAKQLEEEVASLNLEICKMDTTLEAYSSLVARLVKRLTEGAHAPVVDATLAKQDCLSKPQLPLQQELESQLEVLLHDLSDRTAALQEVTSSLATLGFPGSDAYAIVTSLASGFRTARLELEYLTPGEITLPLNSSGPEVLDLLLTRLRALAQRVRANEADIDEYHALEQSLRQQLSARVSAMDDLRAEVQAAKAQLAERDTRISELEIDTDRLRGAVHGYEREMAELETLVNRIEGEAIEAVEVHEAAMRQNKEEVAQRDARIEELESEVQKALDEADAVRTKLDAMKEERQKSTRRNGEALAIRDARVAELRTEIDVVNASLRAAHETIRRTRVESGRWEAKAKEEKLRGKRAVAGVRDELRRVFEMSETVLDTPSKKRTRPDTESGETQAEAEPQEGVDGDGTEDGSPSDGPAVKTWGMFAGNLARRMSAGTKRRKHDSGVGLLDGDEVDLI